MFTCMLRHTDIMLTCLQRLARDGSRDTADYQGFLLTFDHPVPSEVKRFVRRIIRHEHTSRRTAEKQRVKSLNGEKGFSEYTF